MIGETISVSPIDLRARWSDCPAGSSIRLIVNGTIWEETSADTHGECGWHLDAGQAHWCLIEIRSGELLVLTNPIFLFE